MKKIVFVLLVVLNLLVVAPLVMAMPDPFSTLVVWPVNTPEDAEGPIVATSPADLIIYNNDNSHVLDDLWLMLVLNEDAYDNLVSITTNTSLTFLPDHFMEIEGSESPATKIPPYESASGTTPAAPYAHRPNGWPGMEPNDQYDVGSIRSKMGISRGEMYYAVGDLDDSTGWEDHGPTGLNKGDPEFFTLTVTSGGEWKVLVLTLGHSMDYPDTPILNVHSPYTKSTLTIISEPATMLLALASISALGLFKLRHKMRKK